MSVPDHAPKRVPPGGPPPQREHDPGAQGPHEAVGHREPRDPGPAPGPREHVAGDRGDGAGVGGVVGAGAVGAAREEQRAGLELRGGAGGGGGEEVEGGLEAAQAEREGLGGDEAEGETGGGDVGRGRGGEHGGGRGCGELGGVGGSWGELGGVGGFRRKRGERGVGGGGEGVGWRVSWVEGWER